MSPLKDKQKKIHTGFRLSKENVVLLESLENELGINKTSVVDMMLTAIRRDKQLIIRLLEGALNNVKS